MRPASLVSSRPGRHLLAALGALLALVPVGCGGPAPVVVEGELLQNGTPYRIAQGDEVEVMLMGDSAEGKPVWTSGTFDPATGTFRFLGPIGKGVLPGKYKMAVSIREYMKGGPDRLKEEFSQRSTPLAFDVTEGPSPQRIAVDVGTKTVTAR